MALKIVMGIFIAFLVFLAFYLLNHRQGQFIIFDAKNHPPLQKTMTVVAKSLLILAAIGILILLFLPKQFNYITLFSSVMVIFYFTLKLTKYNQ